jgi:AcrR family transcriptional regulator
MALIYDVRHNRDVRSLDEELDGTAARTGAVVPKKPEGQVAPEQYFTAAMRILAGEGASGLKIGTLCRALGVTSGSFYHHFDGWPGFVRGLLEYWEAEQTQRIARLAQATADPFHRVELLKQLAIDLPHEAEAAIRAWATLDTEVDSAQRRVDVQRQAEVQDTIAGVVGDHEVAAQLAELGMAILVGFQQLGKPPEAGRLAFLFQEYQNLIARYAAGDAGRVG